jgi:hypothetical protein
MSSGITPGTLTGKIITGRFKHLQRNLSKSGDFSTLDNIKAKHSSA